MVGAPMIVTHRCLLHSSRIEVTVPEVDVKRLTGFGGVAPELLAGKANAVNGLRMLAEAEGVGVGIGKNAVDAVDAPTLAANVAREPGVAGRVDIFCGHPVANLKTSPSGYDRLDRRRVGSGSSPTGWRRVD